MSNKTNTTLKTQMDNIQKFLIANEIPATILSLVVSSYTSFYIYKFDMDDNDNYINNLLPRLLYITTVIYLTYKNPPMGLFLSLLILIVLMLLFNDKTLTEKVGSVEVPLTPKSKKIIEDSINKSNSYNSLAKKAQEEGDHELANNLVNEVAKQEIKIDGTVKAKQFLAAAKDATNKGDHKTAEVYSNEAKKNLIKVDSLVNSEILRDYAVTANKQGDNKAASQLLKQAETEEKKVKLIIQSDDSLNKAAEARAKGDHATAEVHLDTVSKINDAIIKIASSSEPTNVDAEDILDDMVTGVSSLDDYASY